MSKFTHINEQGNAKMVDVSNKNITKRTAQAHSSITVNETIYQQIIDNTNKKAMYLTLHKLSVLWQNTSTIIPMCHPLPLTGIDVQFNWQINDNTTYTLNITAIVSTTGKTGVEMEALMTASATALTVYDMTKAVDKGMIIGETYLESKSGGKSGDYRR